MEPHLGKRIKCFRSLGFFFFLLLLFFFDFKFVQSSIAEQFSGLFEERNEGKPKTVKKKKRERRDFTQMEIDFHRFATSQRYCSLVPLHELSFHVVITRALIVEEAHAEVLVDMLVPLNAKIFSPKEEIARWQRMGGVKAVENESLSKGTGDLQFRCPTALEMFEELRQLHVSCFTRPPSEDYIDVGQEECPVIPPQGANLLAPTVLRRHRIEHTPSNKFFLMWAAGQVAAVSAETGELIRMPGQPSFDLASSKGYREKKRKSRKNKKGEGVGLDVVKSYAEMEAEKRPVDLVWNGEEMVFSTISIDPDGTHVTAKPSFFEEHTLLVDASHIYRFRMVPKRLSPPTSTAPEVEEGLSNPLSTLRSTSGFLCSAGPQRGGGMLVPLSAALTALSTDLDDQLLRRRSSVTPPSSPHVSRPLNKALLKAVVATIPGVPPPSPAATAALSSTRSPAGGAAGGSAADPVILGSPKLPGRGELSQGTLIAVMGTVERCIGIPESSLFLRGEIFQDGDGGATEAVSRSGSRSPPSDASSHTTYLCSQLAYAGSVMEDVGGVLLPEHVFNLPFEYLYAQKGAFGQPFSLSLTPVRLVLSFITEGHHGGGVQSVVGYTCVTLPVLSPGTHHIRQPVWAIHKTGREALKSALAGGAPSFINLRQAGPFPQSMLSRPDGGGPWVKSIGWDPGRGSGIGVKQGLVTDSIGFMFMTLHVLAQKT